MRYLALALGNRVIVILGSPALTAQDLSLSCSENLRGRQTLLLNTEIGGKVAGFQARFYVA
jgi:hypothetical protein